MAHRRCVGGQRSSVTQSSPFSTRYAATARGSSAGGRCAQPVNTSIPRLRRHDLRSPAALCRGVRAADMPVPEIDLGERFARPGIRRVVGVSERGEQFVGNGRAALGEAGGKRATGCPLGERCRSVAAYELGSPLPKLRVAQLRRGGDRDDPFHEAGLERQREADGAAQRHTGIPDRTVGGYLGRAVTHRSGEILEPGTRRRRDGFGRGPEGPTRAPRHL